MVALVVVGVQITYFSPSKVPRDFSQYSLNAGQGCVALRPKRNIVTSFVSLDKCINKKYLTMFLECNAINERPLPPDTSLLHLLMYHDVQTLKKSSPDTPTVSFLSRAFASRHILCFIGTADALELLSNFCGRKNSSCSPCFMCLLGLSTIR